MDLKEIEQLPPDEKVWRQRELLEFYAVCQLAELSETAFYQRSFSEGFHDRWLMINELTFDQPEVQKWIKDHFGHLPEEVRPQKWWFFDRGRLGRRSKGEGSKLRAALFFNKKTKKVVYVPCASFMTSAGDLLANGSQWLGGRKSDYKTKAIALFRKTLFWYSDQYEAAAQVAENLTKAFPKSRIIISGHSKGGNVAMFVGLLKGIQYVGFNFGGIGENLQRRILGKENGEVLEQKDFDMLQERGERYGRLFITHDDFFTDPNRRGSPMGADYGVRFFGKIFYFEPDNDIRAHSLYAFPGRVVSRDAAEYNPYQLYRPFIDSLPGNIHVRKLAAKAGNGVRSFKLPELVGDAGYSVREWGSQKVSELKRQNLVVNLLRPFRDRDNR